MKYSSVTSNSHFKNSVQSNHTSSKHKFGSLLKNLESPRQNYTQLAKSSVSIKAHTSNISNTSNLASSQTSINLPANQFALNAITQLLGTIANLLQSLGLGSNGLGNQNYGFGNQWGNNHFGNGGVPRGWGHHHHHNCGKPDKPDVPVTPDPKAGDTYIRLGPVDDANKTGELSGTDRPNAREISNAVSAQVGSDTSNANNASDLLWSWGQFIDHDITLTREGHTESANISVPKGDPVFDPAGTGEAYIPFQRSDSITDANGNREQINDQTALIDASMVYGATEEKTQSLRSYEGGKLKMTEDNQLLPDENDVVLAGDKRAAEQPGLLSLHTLFAREHNRQATNIAEKNPNWTDTQIFNEAKRIVTNEIQAITYNEFLPTLLGGEAPVSSRVRYNPETVNGQISSEFAGAAYRLGHTMVSETVTTRNADGSLSETGLDDVFFKPEFTQNKGIGSVLSGMADSTAQAVDPKIVDSLRNRLLGAADQSGPRLDLAAINIQRGRDHNLPSYNDMREALGYKRITSFNDPIFQDGVGAKLAEVYASPDDIDLWIGGLSEQGYGNSMLGITFTSIIDEQFARTAAADANFYTRTASASERAWLNKLTLSDIIRANTQNTQIDQTAFIVD